MEVVWQTTKRTIGGKDIEMETTFNTPQKIGQISLIDRATDKFVTTEEIEITLAFPSTKNVFRVEEIPPLDVFYSPKCRDVIKR